MRPIVFLLAVVLLASAASIPVSHAGPMDEFITKAIQVPAAGKVMTLRFRGGERASVQIIGDRETTVQITIEDAKGVVIADEKGRDAAPDMFAVIWYPPRDGEYKITIRNTENRVAKYYVSVR